MIVIVNGASMSRAREIRLAARSQVLNKTLLLALHPAPPNLHHFLSPRWKLIHTAELRDRRCSQPKQSMKGA